jgi:hypothetical protein
MDEVEIDREDGWGTRVLDDDVLVPDLVDDRARLCHDGRVLRSSSRGLARPDRVAEGAGGPTRDGTTVRMVDTAARVV